MGVGTLSPLSATTYSVWSKILICGGLELRNDKSRLLLRVEGPERCGEKFTL